MNWLEILSEIGQQVLMAVLPLLAGMIAAWLGGLIKQAWAKANEIVGSDWQWALEQGAFMVVRAAEQLEIAGLLEEKKDYAIQTLDEYLKNRGFTVDFEILEAAIEAAVIDNFPKKAAAEA